MRHQESLMIWKSYVVTEARLDFESDGGSIQILYQNKSTNSKKYSVSCQSPAFMSLKYK